MAQVCPLPAAIWETDMILHDELRALTQVKFWFAVHKGGAAELIERTMHCPGIGAGVGAGVGTGVGTGVGAGVGGGV